LERSAEIAARERAEVRDELLAERPIETERAP
jgi:hypothetical protein